MKELKVENSGGIVRRTKKKNAYAKLYAMRLFSLLERAFQTAFLYLIEVAISAIVTKLRPKENMCYVEPIKKDKRTQAGKPHMNKLMTKTRKEPFAFSSHSVVKANVTEPLFTKRRKKKKKKKKKYIYIYIYIYIYVCVCIYI